MSLMLNQREWMMQTQMNATLAWEHAFKVLAKENQQLRSLLLEERGMYRQMKAIFKEHMHILERRAWKMGCVEEELRMTIARQGELLLTWLSMKEKYKQSLPALGSLGSDISVLKEENQRLKKAHNAAIKLNEAYTRFTQEMLVLTKKRLK